MSNELIITPGQIFQLHHFTLEALEVSPDHKPPNQLVFWKFTSNYVENYAYVCMGDPIWKAFFSFLLSESRRISSSQHKELLVDYVQAIKANTVDTNDFIEDNSSYDFKLYYAMKTLGNLGSINDAGNIATSFMHFQINVDIISEMLASNYKLMNARCIFSIANIMKPVPNSSYCDWWYDVAYYRFNDGEYRVTSYRDGSAQSRVIAALHSLVAGNTGEYNRYAYCAHLLVEIMNRYCDEIDTNWHCTAHDYIKYVMLNAYSNGNADMCKFAVKVAERMYSLAKNENTEMLHYTVPQFLSTHTARLAIFYIVSTDNYTPAIFYTGFNGDNYSNIRRPTDKNGNNREFYSISDAAQYVADAIDGHYDEGDEFAASISSNCTSSRMLNMGLPYDSLFMKEYEAGRAYDTIKK